MRSSRKTVSVTTLRLDDEEAQWLREQMQNPLHGQDYTDESAHDKDMRERFFKAVDHPPGDE